MGSRCSCPCMLKSPTPDWSLARFGCRCSPCRVVVLQGRVCSGLWGLGSTTAAGSGALTLLGAGLESSAGTLADSGAHHGWGGCPGLRQERSEMRRWCSLTIYHDYTPLAPSSLHMKIQEHVMKSWLQKLFDIQKLHDLSGLRP